MRSPNRREKQEIARYLISLYPDASKHSTDEVAGTMAQAKIGVVDGYISDGPGYTGKLIFLIYSGGPEIHELLCYRDGKLERVVSEYEHMARQEERDKIQRGEHETREGEFDTLDIPEHDLLLRDREEDRIDELVSRADRIVEGD